MKNKLGHIAIGLFVLNNTAYDLFALPKNTNQTIMFFVLMYGALLIWTIREYLLSINNDLKAKIKGDMYFLAMSIGLAARLIYELTKWGMDYETYYQSVNNYEKGLLFTFLMIALLLIVVQDGKRKNNY